ncbi:VOC family protein [Natrononativus amylolyticus]|uniref:VOC family protein n=1 Tax=Natrononativus amylolyticus TaxID=2963434 RepID=UPI0020CEC577|nr:VOC family protein [Natrononativus amylolyticus]
MTHAPIIPETTRIGRVSLRVENLEDVLEFYRDVVGLAVLSRSDATATLGAGETPLLVLHRDASASPRSHDQAGLFHTAVLVPSRAALGAALERIRYRWQLDGASDHYVSEALYVTDPEGNGVEIYRDLPRAEWPRRDDGTIRIGTVPLDLETVAAHSDGAAAVPDETTVGHVHLEVTSLENARKFYADTLGLGVQTEIRAALFLAAGDYHHHLGLNTWAGRSQPAGGRGLAWVELLVPDEATLEAVRRGLREVEVDVRDVDGGLEIRDPDDVRLRIRSEA